MPEPRIDRLFERYRREGDVEALAAVFDATAPELLRVASHLCRHGADADDVVQQTFLAAALGKERWAPGQPVLPWLLGILANHVRMLRRQRARPIERVLREERPVPDPALAAERHELTEEVARALAGLPDPYGPVLTLHLRHGLSSEEIASSLRRPAGTVRSQVSRGLELLRKALPAGLATGVAVTVSTSRGLAAIRAEVLARVAAAAPPVAPAAALGGLLTMKTLTFALLGGIALSVVLLVSRSWSGAGRGDAAVQGQALPAGASGDAPLAGAAAVRTPVGEAASRPATGAGSLPARRVLVTIEGEVVDDQGRAVPDAEIRLPEPTRPGDEPTGYRVAAHSDAAGRFAIANEPDGSTVWARKPGYAAAFGVQFSAETGAVRIELTRACGSVAGRVVRPDGAPLAGAELTLGTPRSAAQPYDYDRAHMRADRTLCQPFLRLAARTDARGEFVLEDVPSGGWGITATAGGWLAARVDVLVERGQRAEAVVRMRRGASLRGTVADRDGTLAGIAVSVVSLETKVKLAAATTGADGTFTVERVAPGPVRVLAAAGSPARTREEATGLVEIAGAGEPGPAPARGDGRAQVEFVLGEGEVAECRLCLESRPGVRGVLRDPDGRPLPGCNVRLFDPTRRGPGAVVEGDPFAKSYETTTDAAGRFAFERLEGALYSLQADPPESAPLLGPCVRASLVPGGESVVVRLAPGQMPSASLRARLERADGAPAANAGALLSRADTTFCGTLRSDGAGSARLAGLVPGRYAVSGRNLERREFDLAAGQDLDLGVLRKRARGKVTLRYLDATGAPWPGQAPFLWIHSHASSDVWANTGKGPVLELDAGRYSFGADSDLVVSPPVFEVEPGEDKEIALRLAVGKTRTLRFPAAPGSVEHWVRFVVRDRDGNLVWEQRWARHTGEGGYVPWFQCTVAFLPGEYAIEASTANGQRWSHELVVGELVPDDRVIVVR